MSFELDLHADEPLWRDDQAVPEWHVAVYTVIAVACENDLLLGTLDPSDDEGFAGVSVEDRSR